jgi:hypothetical protein
MFVCLMVFNATFNNISVISWQSVLLVEDLEKTTDLSQVTDKLYHIMLYTSSWSSFELTTSVVMGTNCIGSCLSNYHTITTAPVMIIIKYCTKWWEQNYPPFPALILLKLYWTLSFHYLIPVYGTLVIYGKCKLVC